MMCRVFDWLALLSGVGALDEKALNTLWSGIWVLFCHQVASGKAHCVAVARRGQVVAWGSADSGCTGLPRFAALHREAVACADRASTLPSGVAGTEHKHGSSTTHAGNWSHGTGGATAAAATTTVGVAHTPEIVPIPRSPVGARKATQVRAACKQLVPFRLPLHLNCCLFAMVCRSLAASATAHCCAQMVRCSPGVAAPTGSWGCVTLAMPGSRLKLCP